MNFTRISLVNFQNFTRIPPEFHQNFTRILLHFHYIFTRMLHFFRCPFDGCPLGASKKGRVNLPSKHLLSAFYKMFPSNNPSKNLVCILKTLTGTPSKHPSKKHLLLESFLRTLLKSVLLHDPLGVHPKFLLCLLSRNIL